LKSLYPNEDFKYELSAYLSAVRSVADYLLEEYNDKFKLGIPLTDKLTIQKFKDEAASSGNATASVFIKWYEAKISTIGTTLLGEFCSREEISTFTERKVISMHELTSANS
jgi:hypothetical protein